MDLPVLLEKLVMFLGVFFAVILLVIVAIALDLFSPCMLVDGYFLSSLL